MLNVYINGFNKMKLNNMNVQNFIKSDTVTRKQFLFLSLLTITVEVT